MSPLLSDAEITGLRAAFGEMLSHVYTRTPMVLGTGSTPDDEDDWGEKDAIPDATAGAVVTGVPCLYALETQVRRDGGGITTVIVPTLTVAATDVLKTGDMVGTITGSNGDVLEAGPLRVERLIADASGLGASLLKTWELRAARVSS